MNGERVVLHRNSYSVSRHAGCVAEFFCSEGVLKNSRQEGGQV